MTRKEIDAYEAFHRERKAAKLALRIALALPSLLKIPPTALAAVLKDPRVRKDTQTTCGYGHVSEETWERVLEMLQDARPGRTRRARRKAPRAS